MGVLVAGLLAVMLLSNLIPDPAGSGEWRIVARPQDNLFQRLHGNLRSISFYFKDNFGFRASLPQFRRELREFARSPDTKLIYFGPKGQVFWSLQRAPEQTSGQIYRMAAVQRFVSVIEAMQARLPNTKIVVALPPNAQTVDVENLPDWFNWVKPRPTEYALMLAELAHAGITAVDLRAVLRASPQARKYLANDTHWNNLSATLALNAAMVAAGHPDWQVDVAAAVGPMKPAPLGDIATALNLRIKLPNENQELRLNPAWQRQTNPDFKSRNEMGGFNPYFVRFRDSGPRVMVLGDSYTVDSWPYLLGYTPVAEVAWVHFSKAVYGSCDFDFADVERFAPQVLIIARTERMFPCLKGEWPANLPQPAPEARK